MTTVEHIDSNDPSIIIRSLTADSSVHYLYQVIDENRPDLELGFTRWEDSHTKGVTVSMSENPSKREEFEKIRDEIIHRGDFKFINQAHSGDPINLRNV